MRDRLMRTVSFNFNFRTIAYDNLIKRSYESFRMKIKIFDASLLGKINQISLNPCRIKVRVKLEEKYIHISWKKIERCRKYYRKENNPIKMSFIPYASCLLRLKNFNEALISFLLLSNKAHARRELNEGEKNSLPSKKSWKSGPREREDGQVGNSFARLQPDQK